MVGGGQPRTHVMTVTSAEDMYSTSVVPLDICTGISSYVSTVRLEVHETDNSPAATPL